MKATPHTDADAVVIGLGVVVSHPKWPGKYILPGGKICDRDRALAVAKKIHQHIKATSKDQ